MKRVKLNGQASLALTPSRFFWLEGEGSAWRSKESSCAPEDEKHMVRMVGQEAGKASARSGFCEWLHQP